MTVSEYNKCVEKYSDNLYRFALKSLQNSDLARDVVQDSLLKLWETRDNVVRGKEKSYLFTIAYHFIINNVRYEKRYLSDEKMPVKTGQFKDTIVGLNEMLNVFLDKLPDLQKHVLMLRDYEGYSYKEIAEITSLTESQVKVYIFRARVALKKIIGDINYLL